MKWLTSNPKCKSEDNSAKVKIINEFKEFFTCDGYS